MYQYDSPSTPLSRSRNRLSFDSCRILPNKHRFPGSSVVISAANSCVKQRFDGVTRCGSRPLQSVLCSALVDQTQTRAVFGRSSCSSQSSASSCTTRTARQSRSLSQHFRLPTVRRNRSPPTVQLDLLLAIVRSLFVPIAPSTFAGAALVRPSVCTISLTSHLVLSRPLSLGHNLTWSRLRFVLCTLLANCRNQIAKCKSRLFVLIVLHVLTLLLALLLALLLLFFFSSSSLLALLALFSHFIASTL
jgi:hypothetical protein